MVKTYKTFRFVSSSGARFHELEIWNRLGLWGEIVKSTTLCSIDDLFAEARALVDNHLATPQIIARLEGKQ